MIDPETDRLTDDEEVAADAAWAARDERHRASRRKGVHTALWVIGLLLTLIAAFPLFVHLDWFDFRFRVLGLLLLGMFLSIGLGAGLMALSFHSARSGIDDESGVLPSDAQGEQPQD